MNVHVGYELVCSSTIVYGNVGRRCPHRGGYELIQSVYTRVERTELTLGHVVHPLEVRLG